MSTVYDVVSAVSRVDAKFAAAHGLPPAKEGLFVTSAQQDLMCTLIDMTCRLSQSGFYSHGDQASCVVHGPRGIGKSATLNTFAAVVPLLLPNVVPIYVSYLSPRMVYRSPNSVVVGKLMEAGFDMRQERDLDTIATALEKERKFALLLLDEVENLYAARLPWWSRFSTFGALETVQTLAELGDHRSGRFSTICVGRLACSRTCCSEREGQRLRRKAIPTAAARDRSKPLKISKTPSCVRVTRGHCLYRRHFRSTAQCLCLDDAAKAGRACCHFLRRLYCTQCAARGQLLGQRSSDGRGCGIVVR